MKTRKLSTRMLILLLTLAVSAFGLVGGTIAWFTDTVESSNNIIASGTLDVEMYWADGKEDPANAIWTDASTGSIFNYDKWEPGYTEVRHIQIKNVGSLALKYQLIVAANGMVSKLADVIDVYYADPAVQIADRTVLTEENKIGSLTEVLAGINTASGKLEAGETVTVTLGLKMQESAGNEYQGLAIGSDFALKLFATQATVEEDAFDDQYDVNAKLPVPVSLGITLNDARDIGGNFYLMDDVELDSAFGVINGADMSLDLNGQEMKINGSDYAIRAYDGSTLTFNGDGIVEMGDGIYANSGSIITINGGTYQFGSTGKNNSCHIQNSSKLIINDGNFISNDDNAPILYCINGFIEINGGFFKNEANPNAALLSMGNNLNYINNQKITLSGGTFVNWNPMNSAFARPWTNPTVPALIVLADGYEIISETQENGDVWYSVVPVTPAP